MLNQKGGNYWQMKSPTSFLNTPVSVLQLLTVYGKPDLQTLQLLEDEYPLYSPTTQDGNSFYRSIAFVYILSSEDWTFESIFSKIGDVDLAIVDIQTIPQQFLNIYINQQLKEALKDAWKTFVEETSVGRTLSAEGLIQVINQRSFLDFLIILYFRSLNFISVAQKTKSYSIYSTSESLEKSIKTYANPPSIEEMKSLAKVLKNQIYLVTIDQNNKVNSEVLSGVNSYYNVLKRLPLIKFRGSFNPLYNVKQAKAFKIAFKKQFVDPGYLSESEPSQEIKVDEKYLSFSESQATVKKNNTQYKLIQQRPEKLHFQFTDEEQETKLPNFAPARKSTSPQNNYTEQPELETNVRKQFTFERTIRLLFLIVFFSSALMVFYRYKFPKTNAKSDVPLRPARQVHFVKDVKGNYKIDY